MDTDSDSVTPDGEQQHAPAFAWEGSAATGADPAPPAPPPARRGRRPLVIAGVAVAAAAAAGLALALSGGGKGPAAPGTATAGHGGRVVLAADVTTREPGFKFTMDAAVTGAGKSVTIDGSGAFNLGPPPSGSMHISAAGFSIDELIDGGAIYMRLPVGAGGWYKLDYEKLLAASGSSSEITNANPTQTLQMLRAAGSVTTVGDESIGGISTTHYHAQIDLSQYLSSHLSELPASVQAGAQKGVQALEQMTGSTTLPIDVWIDGSNLVRRIQLDLEAPAQHLGVTMTMNFPDYGPQPAVTPPPADQVTDLSNLAGSGLSQGLAGLGGAGSS